MRGDGFDLLSFGEVKTGASLGFFRCLFTDSRGRVKFGGFLLAQFLFLGWLGLETKFSVERICLFKYLVVRLKFFDEYLSFIILEITDIQFFMN